MRLTLRDSSSSSSPVLGYLSVKNTSCGVAPCISKSRTRDGQGPSTNPPPAQYGNLRDVSTVAARLEHRCSSRPGSSGDRRQIDPEEIGETIFAREFQIVVVSQPPLFLILRSIVLQPTLVNSASSTYFVRYYTLSPQRTDCHARTHLYLLLVMVLCLYTWRVLRTSTNAQFLENCGRLRCQTPRGSTQAGRCLPFRAHDRYVKGFCARARAIDFGLCASEILSSLLCIRVSARFRCACILGCSAG